MRVALIGGDKREVILANLMADMGHQIKVLGTLPGEKKTSIECYQQLEQVLSDVEVIIAPMSGTDEKGYLKKTFTGERVKLDEEFFSLLKPGALFFIGTARPAIIKLLKQKEIKYVQLALVDELAILNAIPTAEGAIKITIEETDYTIFGSRTLVFGLGKVGLTLAWRLRALGAESYAVTRDQTAIARGKDLGIKMISYHELANYLPTMNILYNTVPAQVISEQEISLLKPDSLIIDLASAPGGTDFQAAEAKGIKAILALGLPGIVAPRSAGEILAEVIPDLISANLVKE